ncbi:MAG TPA: 6-bladed beta-propeller [Hyalangium sp.]|nr:6-bladed beta-propeller [Hyalangium sp.]
MRTLLLVAVVGLCACADDPERFDRPTNVAFASNGDVYVSDGYNNARVARFSADGRFLMEWGERGFGRGQFNTPHGIVTDDTGRVYVVDRENARIQVFDADGHYVTEWKGGELGRPWAIAFGSDGFFYVVDGGDQDSSRPRGHVLRLDREGRILDRWSSFGDGLGEVDWGHGIAVGGDGSVYVGSIHGQPLQKFQRVR